MTQRRGGEQAGQPARQFVSIRVSGTSFVTSWPMPSPTSSSNRFNPRERNLLCDTYSLIVVVAQEECFNPRERNLLCDSPEATTRPPSAPRSFNPRERNLLCDDDTTWVVEGSYTIVSIRVSGTSFVTSLLIIERSPTRRTRFNPRERNLLCDKRTSGRQRTTLSFQSA